MIPVVLGCGSTVENGLGVGIIIRGSLEEGRPVKRPLQWFKRAQEGPDQTVEMQKGGKTRAI